MDGRPSAGALLPLRPRAARGHLDEALRITRWHGAATFYFTDRTDRGGTVDPWETMPGYWDEIVSRLGTGVSE